MKIEARPKRSVEQRGGDVIIRTGRRWLRLAAYYGSPPGSHIGFWRTRGGLSGSLRGWNLRIGKRYVGPCLTAFAHTRRLTGREL